MNQTTLFLLLVAITGIYSSRWMLRLAPLTSELPLKTLLATLLSGAVVLLSFTQTLSSSLVLLTLLLAPLYVFAPLILTALSRARRYTLVQVVVSLLYWTEEGRRAIGQLLAQVALQQGDAEAALRFAADNENGKLLRIQAYALQERWYEVLNLDLPEGGDNIFLALSARAQAYLALEKLAEAEQELMTMQRRWQEQGQGPLGYRSIQLTRARIAAAQGNFEEARGRLQEPLPGVPSHLVLGVLGEAAERQQRPDLAIKLYSQAYSYAPEGLRPKFAAKLKRYGQSLPTVARRGIGQNPATIALGLSIIATFVLQSWLDRRYGQNVGSIIAGFLLNVPGVPAPDGLWRYLSYAFVHGNLVHIGFNAWVLFDIGRLYEARRHWGSLLTSFVFGTVMGAYLTVLAQGSDQLVLVGASGGILGIAGALLADTLRGHSVQDRLLTRSLLQWMVLIVLFSLAIPNVSLWGHVGGVLGGLLWGFARQGLSQSKRIDLLAGGFSITLMIYALLMAAQWFIRYV